MHDIANQFVSKMDTDKYDYFKSNKRKTFHEHSKNKVFLDKQFEKLLQGDHKMALK